ncbi:hypothetical protein ID866_12590 [Astraeus odoratus]|nr:hypothetical protein ID866_12590 [Astraeus odoratus]
MISGSSDKTVRVWDAERGVQIGSPLESHTENVTSVALSPDGTRITSGSTNKTVVVLKLTDHIHITCNLAVLHPLSYKGCGSVHPLKLHHDGWIKGHNNVLLLWIPPALQNPFYSMHTIVVIPKGGCAELDLSKMIHGKEWQNCFKGTPQWI